MPLERSGADRPVEIAVVGAGAAGELLLREIRSNKNLNYKPVGFIDDDIKKIVDKIESKLKSLNTTEIKSTIIGEEVMRSLKKLDKVAYIRFASVYKDFKDVKDFRRELNELKS